MYYTKQEDYQGYSQINSNITAADGSRFRYAVTDDGKPGCIITGEDGADTVFPFSGSYTVIFRLTLSVHGWTDGKNYGSYGWNITAKISDGKCTFSPSSVPMINSILSSELNGQRRVYVPWSIALISITAD